MLNPNRKSHKRTGLSQWAAANGHGGQLRSHRRSPGLLAIYACSHAEK